MAATDSPKQWSPKVLAFGAIGGILAAIASGVAIITPQMLEGLGPWDVPAAIVLTTLAGGYLAWWRTDPLRVNYFQQKAAVEAAEAERIAEAQAAEAANEEAETEVDATPVADGYQGKHVADPTDYDVNDERPGI